MQKGKGGYTMDKKFCKARMMSKAEILEHLEREIPHFTLESKARLLVERGITDEVEMYRVVKNALYC